MGFFKDVAAKKRQSEMLTALMREYTVGQNVETPVPVLASRLVLEAWKADKAFFNGEKHHYAPTDLGALVRILTLSMSIVSAPRLIVIMVLMLHFQAEDLGFQQWSDVNDSDRNALAAANELLDQIQEFRQEVVSGFLQEGLGEAGC